MLHLQHTIGNRAVQRLLSADEASTTPSPDVLARIVEAGLSSPSQELRREARETLEPVFDRDFGQVRVHTGPVAAASAAALNAVAYTTGKDIVFAEGRYAPSTGVGLKLLAHELVHVIQQGGRSGIPGGPVEVGERSDPMEREAEAIAGTVTGDRAAAPVNGSSDFERSGAAAQIGKTTLHSGEPAPSVQREAGEEEKGGIWRFLEPFALGHAVSEFLGASELGKGLEALPGGGPGHYLAPAALMTGAHEMFHNLAAEHMNLANTGNAVFGGLEALSGGLGTAAWVTGAEAVGGALGPVASAGALGYTVGKAIEERTHIGDKLGDAAYESLGPGLGRRLADVLPAWLQ